LIRLSGDLLKVANVGTARKETAVKVYHAKKMLQLFDILRGRQASITAVCSVSRACRRDGVLQNFQGWNSKNTFFQMNGESIGGLS
jgi:hypothetical protein